MQHFYAYLAGLIDADGSIYVRLKKNSTHRYDFQIVPCVVIFQHRRNYPSLKLMQKRLGYGHIRKRNDDMLELTFSKQNDIKTLLSKIMPFLIIKKNQAKLTVNIIDNLRQIHSAQDFLNLAKKIDRFQQLNFSTKRKNNAQMVGNHLIKQGILTP